MKYVEATYVRIYNKIALLNMLYIWENWSSKFITQVTTSMVLHTEKEMRETELTFSSKHNKILFLRKQRIKHLMITNCWSKHLHIQERARKNTATDWERKLPLNDSNPSESARTFSDFFLEGIIYSQKT